MSHRLRVSTPHSRSGVAPNQKPSSWIPHFRFHPLSFILVFLFLLPVVVQAQDKVFIYDSAGRVKALIDPSADPATNVAVYSYDQAGNVVSITRGSSATVSVIAFSPESGAAGAAVTIFGTNFSSVPSENTVRFNGVLATVTSSTTTQINTSVPAGATTGRITVERPGIGLGTSSTDFTVTTAMAPPTITTITPTIGAATTPVTITGTNFDGTTRSNNRVAFNITGSGVNSATATTITTNVPVRAGSGRISVTTPAGRATSSADFFIPPSQY